MRGTSRLSPGFPSVPRFPIAGGPNYASDFHDITTSSNGGYSAGYGYDLVTGWGSPTGQALMNDLEGPPTPPFLPNNYNCSGNVSSPEAPTLNDGSVAILMSWGGRTNTAARGASTAPSSSAPTSQQLR